ncbi:neuropeptide Y receptor type 6-like [Perognathus longimembris pacificus]|uniref:neuropeptide Y receptor type 6-like n=1 Tax=Perognathus longimembris pacificus TaxID=214514 RepID=UPI00201981C7|nr:neuropeptide Y receptor type 6-like [Perognathus longimembris pacificus]
MEVSRNQTPSNRTMEEGNYSSAFSHFESCQPSSAVLFLFLIAYAAVLILGLLGNLSLIIIIVKKQREAQSVTNILIANLSLSDILVCVMCIPLTVTYTLMDHWVFGELMCKLTSYVQSVSISVSIFSLVLIAVERHQLIVKPRGWKPGVPHAYWGVTFVWFLSFLLSVPLFLAYHLTEEPFLNLSLPADLYGHRVACVETWPSRTNQLLFSTSLFLLQYFVPLGFILVCYLKIVLYLRRRNRKAGRRKEKESRFSESKRVNTTLVAIVAAFGACWLPLNVFNIIFDWHHEVLMSCHHDLVFITCHFVAMVSTCINPLFYGFLNRNFQKDLMVLLHYCCCFPPQERYENIVACSLHTDESKGSLRLAHLPTSI